MDKDYEEEKMFRYNKLQNIMEDLKSVQEAILRGENYIIVGEGCKSHRIYLQDVLRNAASMFDMNTGGPKGKLIWDTMEEIMEWKNGAFERIQERSFKGTEFEEIKEKIRDKLLDLKQRADELGKNIQTDERNSR